MCGAEKAEGPVRRATRSGPQISQCLLSGTHTMCGVKSPKGLFAGTPSRCGPANSVAPVAQNISLLVLVCVWLTDMVCVLRNSAQDI